MMPAGFFCPENLLTSSVGLGSEPGGDIFMVLATIRMNIPRKKRNEAVKILNAVAQQCHFYPGCLGCHLYDDVQEAQVLLYEEMWKSEEDLERHLRSERYRDVLLVMEMALRQPEVRFNTVSASTGFETIEKARSYAR
jgi:quinol monooxygenase YgiN